MFKDNTSLRVIFGKAQMEIDRLEKLAEILETPDISQRLADLYMLLDICIDEGEKKAWEHVRWINNRT